MPIDKKSLKPYSKSASATQPALQGVWQNELGSTMTITSFDGTTFSGTYESAVSGGGAPVTGPLAGTLAGDAIGFTVNWSSATSSVTSWNGLLLSDGNALYLYTLWYLASTPGSAEDYWESILAGADIFVQQ